MNLAALRSRERNIRRGLGALIGLAVLVVGVPALLLRLSRSLLDSANPLTGMTAPWTWSGGEIKDALTRGSSIAAQMRSSGEFPPLVTHMIAVGEASGELPAMLGKLADTYDTQVENALQRMLALLGPILLVFVALVILVIILSTLLPLMNMTSAL